MSLSEILVGRKLVTVADVAAAIERQHTEGGRLGENLIALGRLSAEDLAAAVRTAPPTPATVADTGIAPRALLDLALKFMLLDSAETVQDLSHRMKLTPRIIQEVLDEAISQKLLLTRGTVAGSATLATRYALTEEGRTAAKDVASQNLYLGPAPVPLTAWQDQIAKQGIRNETLDEAALRRCFAGLVVPEHYLHKVLPAITAGRSVLLFGPPGNGKTTMATRIATLFRDVIFIPYAVEVGGQTIKVFDRTLHKPAVSEADAAALAAQAPLHREGFDERWVACGRPVAVTGGELTLEMLDLQYSSDTGFYDAPLHVKAINGMLLIDDFGRQKFNPNDLLNRWIVPMENQIDFFKLNTGATFQLPFDVLLIFSTNLQPGDLVDPAFLRRIPYKIRLFAPNRDEYHQIFAGVSKASGVEVPDDVFDYIVETLSGNNFELAYYQPRFICNQALEACKCFGFEPRLTKAMAAEALTNLYFDLPEPAEPDEERKAAE
jgi:hypothetical protein